MKIVVVSDSHGNREILQKIVNDNQDASLFIHAGDSQVLPQAIDPFRAVKGNCDIGYDYPKELYIETPYGNIYVTHGHQFYQITKDFIKSKHCKIFIFGHTHKHYLEKCEDSYVCNPGSVTRPRDKTNGTYLVINLTQNDVNFDFKYL